MVLYDVNSEAVLCCDIHPTNLYQDATKMIVRVKFLLQSITANSPGLLSPLLMLTNHMTSLLTLDY